MTLTEEQRGTVGFDLEKARAGISHYRIENPSNVDTESALKELVDQANLAEDALAEIERLRAALAESEKIVEHKSKSATHWYDEHLRAQTDLTQSERVIEQQAARIKELGSSLDEAEALTKKNADLMNGYLARIAELEEWLKKERSARLLEQTGSILLAYLKENEIDFDIFFDGKALEQLQAEGKIGPDARPPCWQITEERMRAIRMAEELAWDCKAVAVLRAMLQEAGL